MILQEILSYWFELVLVMFLAGFGLHMGLAVASMFFPIKQSKSITYDNLDK